MNAGDQSICCDNKFLPWWRSENGCIITNANPDIGPMCCLGSKIFFDNVELMHEGCAYLIFSLISESFLCRTEAIASPIIFLTAAINSINCAKNFFSAGE